MIMNIDRHIAPRVHHFRFASVMTPLRSIRGRSYVGWRRMEKAARLDHDHLWHAFTQQRDWANEEPLMIESAEGAELIDGNGRRYLDGVSSLWCNVHGHRHPAIDQAVRDQLDRVAHSTMLGLSHRGAAE